MKKLTRIVIIFLIFIFNKGYTQEVYLEADTLYGDEIYFKSFPLLKATDTLNLFNSFGYPILRETYKEQEMDIEFAEIHYHYEYNGYKILLFVAENELYFDAFYLENAGESITLKNNILRVGDSANRLAELFPISCLLYTSPSPRDRG